MAAMVQTLPSTTSTMLQQRPNSADRFSPSPSHHHHNSRSSPKYGSTSSTGYRGVPPSGPVAPYAFTSTPQLGSNSSPHRSQPSSPPLATSTAPQLPQLNLGGISGDMSLSNSTTSKSMPPSPSASNFQTVIKPSENMNRTDSSQSLSTPSRYRNIRRTDTGDSGTPKPHGSAMPSGSGMAAVGQLYNHPSQSSSTPSLNSNSSYRGTQYGSAQPSKPSNDEMQVGRQQEKDQASRYRRRSINNIETAGLTHASNDPNDKPTPHPNTFVHHQQQRPISAHKHTGSSESAASAVSGPSSRPGSARQESMTTSPQHGHAAQMGHIAKQDVRMVNVPQRHNDNNRRIPSGVATPSPLSRPMSPSAEDDTTTALPPKPKASPAPAPTAAPALSPAAAHLAALDQKEAKKSKSKLRRAFSFGSAAELRKVTAQANLEKSNATTTTSKRISRHEEELDPESARVAAKQEAAGLGESIYSGQGNFFTGSTDNLSISSTASSASIMLRKMGKGMKKGGRSLVGLFRPKSVVGVPAADGPVNQASAAQVSMMTVEAEREKVNVNLDPHAHQGGGTGFPKLERNSIDNKMSLDSGTASTDTRSRRSIVGGERERAEVLAAVKKGILKRNGSNQASPTLRPNDSRAPELTLPNIPHVNDSPRSSAPSTPKDEPLPVGHKRTDSVTINDPHDDYFGSGSRFTSLDSNTGQPITPNRNISFSPRIQFYDTWTSGEYDRRGEIATCNRLTPMLAQQIKEELNSFKMEMEVAESSKVYTHFF